MLFHSRAAYNELRHFFNNNLPAQRTVQRWLQCVDASPGISRMACDAIAQKVKEYKDKNENLNLCLVHDEMSIKKYVSWNREKQLFEGFSTVASENEDDNDQTLSVAKDALVYMAVGPDFRIAVAYFLLSGLDAIDRASLTKEVITKVENTGAVVTSLTGDGLLANTNSYEALGADFKSNKPFFFSPSNPQKKIYVIYDAPHMLKLVRKDFSSHKLYHGDKLLRWELLEKLAKKQDCDNFELANKLSHRRHINWKMSPMTVRYAAETISNGVADVLEQLCDDNYADFVGCESTVKFLRLHNNLFDVMNCGDGKKANDQFKQPFSAQTMPRFQELFEEYKKFVDELSFERTTKRGTERSKVQPTKNKFVGFFGFLHNITSLIGIYTDYYHKENGPMNVFYSF